MAQITWRNIDAPNLTSSIVGIDVASRTLDRALQSFTGIADSNAAQIQKNIQSLDDQGQAAILQQMAAFSTPEQLTAAIQAGTFDDVMAGMTGSAQVAAQAKITDRSDTLLDQSMRDRSLKVREAEQAQAEKRYKEIEKPQFDMTVKTYQRDIKNTEAANAVVRNLDPVRESAELAENFKRVDSQFFETNPEWYDEDGNLVRERVTDQAAIEKFQADYAALRVSDSLRYQNMLTTLAETVDVDSPQYAQAKMVIDQVRQLRNEGTAFSQSQLKQASNNWKLLNRAHNNPFIEHDEMVASGKSLHQTLVDDGIFDEIMKKSDKYPSSLIRGMQEHALKGTVRVNGVDVPITPSMFKIAAAKGADAAWWSKGDTFEHALEKLALQAIGEDPSMPTLIEQRDAYRAAMNAERAKHSGDPYIALAQNADYWRQAAEANRERAAAAANPGGGSSSEDNSALDSVVRNVLADNSSSARITSGSINTYLKQNGGQLETLSKSAIPKMSESEMATYQTMLVNGVLRSGSVIGVARKRELIEFLNGINSR